MHWTGAVSLGTWCPVWHRSPATPTAQRAIKPMTDFGLPTNAIVHDPRGGAHFREFLELFNAIRTLQAEHVEASREELLRALMGHGVSLTPAATLSQSKRLATHRNVVLATPFHTDTSLSEQRDSSESNTRTWVARRRQAHKLFTVDHDGRTLIPAFQFDEHGKLRTELAPLLAALVPGGSAGLVLMDLADQPDEFSLRRGTGAHRND
jgi:hypothetical protein